ncbi:divalent-cation tolerance protein CutA [bacterium]|nr:divalent-cation tolerance protein CutA [bacterium]
MVFCMASSEDEALRISETLVQEQLAACVNRFAGAGSIYMWKGEICHDEEWMLIIKTRTCCMERLISRLKSVHSYEVPEIIAVPIVDGSKEYLDWLQTNTK